LIDLKDQSFKKQIVIVEWESILRIVIDLVEGVLRMSFDVVTVGGHKIISISGRMRG
jgi:hypothetical protein